jgi:hypothetical protein
MDHTEFGWLFLYVCFFGLSDYIVNRWIKTDISYIIYYLIVGIVGFGLLYYKTQTLKKERATAIK